MKTVRIFWKNGKTTEIEIISFTECEKFWLFDTLNGELRVPLAFVDDGEIEQ